MFAGLVEQGKTIIMVTHDSSLAKRVQRTVLVADGQVVNEYVARALPLLTTDQMLFATQQLEPRRYSPRETIIEEGQPGDRFYIITSGTVEVYLHRPDGHEVLAARRGRGQYVGEVALVGSRRTIASVRAGEGPVEAVTLDRETFRELLAQSEATRDAVEAIAAEREADTLARREATDAAALA
jgi:CRP-like cAMP-binding protein